MNGENAGSEPTMGILELRRTSDADCKDRIIQVYLDGKNIDEIYFGETKQYPLAPGRYQLTIDNTLNKKKMDFDLRGGSTVIFQCGHKATDAGLVFGMILGTAFLTTFLERAG